MGVPLSLSYGLLFLAALVLYLPITPTPIDLSDTDIGYLRRGTRGAVLTAFTGLRARGLIAVRKRGGVRRTNRVMSTGWDDLERAVYGALHTAAGPRSVASRPAVRRALDATANRLAGAGLIASQFRQLIGRALLIAVPVVAVVGMVQTSAYAGLAVAILIAIGLWLPARRTVAGHGVLHVLRREHTQLVAGWRPTEHEPHDASLDAKLSYGVAASRASLLCRGFALGMVIDLIATGVHAFDSGGHSDAGFDGSDSGWDDGGFFDGGDFGWDGSGSDGGGYDGGFDGGGFDGGGGGGSDGGS
jgi:uncharacterized protein (TIGR04222 family)